MAMNRRRFVTSMTVLGAGALFTRPRLSLAGAEEVLPFPELRAAGAAGDLGLAHGRAFATQIEHNLRFYLRWLSRSGQVPSARLLEIAGGFPPVIETSFPEMVEEMEGIAMGAGRTLADIALINARTDVLAIVENQDLQEKVPACTALALFGEVDGRPAVALGQNWDWNPELAKAPVVLRLEPDHAPALVTLTEAGMLGKIGFNQHRLGVCLNFLSHRSDGPPDRFGVPVHCLLRAVMTCETIEDAVEAVDSSPRCASANFLIAQHGADGPEALDLEITPDEVIALRTDGDDLVHTNHFLDPLLAEGDTSGRGPSTMTRCASAQILDRIAELHEADPVARLEGVLVSREGMPYPISRDSGSDASTATLAGVVMDLTGNRLILTAGPPHANPWIGRPGVE
jgi:isopenicillin-N N-acyltransferase-like protein